jgi:hypothetical protein
MITVRARTPGLQVGDTDDPITEEQIKAFADAWYRALDVHTPVEDLLPLLADSDLEMIFPERTLYSVDDFKTWYAGGTYSDGTTAPGVTRVFFDEDHIVVGLEARITADRADVSVMVAWQASWYEPPAAKSKRTSLNATQTWTLRRSIRNPYGLEIATYNAVAAPFAYAPGFAHL